MVLSSIKSHKILILTLVMGMTLTANWGYANERSTSKYYEKIKQDPSELRIFLKQFPKGGELHNHIDGAIFSETHLNWAIKDNKCIHPETFKITFPPCHKPAIPATRLLQYSTLYQKAVNAFSVRNYRWGNLSGHDQFFATFDKFLLADAGHFGDMLAKVSSRSAKQNLHYLELMQSIGMPDAWTYAAGKEKFAKALKNRDRIAELIKDPAIQQIKSKTISILDKEEKLWHTKLQCSSDRPQLGCKVKVTYLAQVIRTFPNEQIMAQTVLAFLLVQSDPRYVGINFVAPEDDRITLENYTRQMEIIRDVAQYFPKIRDRVTLHSGELVQGLVPNEALESHIREAIEIAGATRIGHGVDIAYENNPHQLVKKMASEKIAVEINLTSNDVILGIKGNKHPYPFYHKAGVPIVISTDDEGVLRIDITHEYQRLVETYPTSYKELKKVSRNALEYSFLDGKSLFQDYGQVKKVKVCQIQLTSECQKFLNKNPKANQQWLLESRFHQFEKKF